MTAKGYFHPVYLNWDNPDHRQKIARMHWSPDADLLILDEVHKNPDWKNLIKGISDTRTNDMHVLITSSSRLNIFRKGGDSLAGRYHLHRLHPFSVKEYSPNSCESCQIQHDIPPELDFSIEAENLVQLLKFGGFPEPLLASNKRQWRRWKRNRFETVIREDIRDTSRVNLITKLETMGGLLSDRVCSPLSMDSLAGDLQVSPKTVKSWLSVFCENYFAYKIPPYHKSLERALRKE